jgi:hypothetical protein
MLAVAEKEGKIINSVIIVLFRIYQTNLISINLIFLSEILK